MSQGRGKAPPSPPVLSEYEKKRARNMEENAEHLELLNKVKIGKVVHVPWCLFKNYPKPEGGKAYWVGKTVHTYKGGTGDIGIHIPNEPIFTYPRKTVLDWIQPD